ncbi:methyltransferase [Streptomyces sp. NPDC055036]
MTQTHAVVTGLERLGGTPALIHGRTVLSGARVLAQARRLAHGPRDRVPAGDEPGALSERLASLLTGGASPDAGSAAFVERLRQAYGDDVREVAVLGDLADVGGDAALAAWAAGAAVVCGSGLLSPARALALLERTGADTAFAPAALLCALPEHPSAALTDLTGLRRVVHCDQPPPGDGLALVADALGVTVARVPRPGAAPSESGSGRDREDAVAEAARVAGLRGVGGIDLAAAVAAVGDVARAALLSMLGALHGQGLFASPAADATGHTEAEVLAEGRIAERYHGLARRWLTVLTAEGLLRRDCDRFRLAVDSAVFTGSALRRAWDEAEKAWRATAGEARTLDYARRSAEALPGLLTGATDAVSLLFPQGGMCVAEPIYRESVTARYQHHAVAGLLADLAAHWPRHRPLSVLEVGAGTGATTERALPALTAPGAGLTYLFTDVTPFFLERARERWGGIPGVGFGRLDIDSPAAEQGFAAGSFDVVLAGEALNAARDTDACLRSLAGLLAPDGWLVFTEPTAEEYWVMITQAFLMTDAQDGRADTGATFLSLGQWRLALDTAGLRRVVDLPEPGHPLDGLGHRVFAARPRPA